MISSTTITRTHYFVVCCECGENGPDGYTKQEAHDAAIRDEWTSRTIYPSGEMVEVYTCPDHDKDGAS